MYQFVIKGKPSEILAQIDKMVKEEQFQTYLKRQEEAEQCDRDFEEEYYEAENN